jgi:hypothetical protein
MIGGGLFQEISGGRGIRGIVFNGPLCDFRRRDGGLDIDVRPSMSPSPLRRARRNEYLKTTIARSLSDVRPMLEISNIPSPSPHLLKETTCKKDARPR